MADVEVASVLPKELRLGVPPKMPQARSYLFRQQSTISSYSPGNTIQINIPRLQRSYLRKDSYLRFRVAIKRTTAVANDFLALDTAGAFGFIEKLEVFDYLGSTVLESISGVPQLSALLLDLGLSEIANSSNGMAAMGLERDFTAATRSGVVETTTDVNTALNSLTQIQYTMSGTVLKPTTGLFIDNNANASTDYNVREFAIPLPSFLGLLSNKMIPLHNGFTIVLTLANVNTPFISITPQSESRIAVAFSNAAVTTSNSYSLPATNNPATIDWRVQDVNMECQILELGPIAESMLLSASQGQPLIVHTKAFRNYVGSVKGGSWSTVPQSAAAGAATTGTDGQAEFTLNLNLNVASLTNILWFMRPFDHLDKIQFNSVGNRTRNFLWKWQFQYGSTTLPQNNGIEAMSMSVPSNMLDATAFTNFKRYEFLSHGFTECYNELMKARPNYLPNTKIDLDSYRWDRKFNQSLDLSAANGIGDLNMYGIWPGFRNVNQMGRFACGLNLELASKKDGTIISGLNTNGMNTSIRGFFHPQYLKNMDTVRVDAFAEYDAFVNISPGIATTISF